MKIETGAGTVPVVLERAGSRTTFGRMQQPIPSWAAYERAPEFSRRWEGSRVP